MCRVLAPSLATWALALVLAVVAACAAAQFAPSRSTDGAVAEWRFDEATGSTVADRAALAPALPLVVTSGAPNWRTDTFGCTVAPGSGSPGFDGTSATGVAKVFASVEAPYGYTFSAEAWVRPSAFPAAGSQHTIFQLCDSDQNFVDYSLRSPCIKLGLFSPPGSGNSTFSAAFGLMYEDLAGSFLRVDAFGFTTEFTRVAGQLSHLVARYTVSVPAPVGQISPGSGLLELFVNGVAASNEVIGSRTTTGVPISSWSIATPAVEHSWHHHPVGQRRASVGFSRDLSGAVLTATEFDGDVFLLALYNVSLSATTITEHFRAGPPSRPPVALAQSIAVSTAENVNVSFTLPVSDVDASLGFDLVLGAELVSVAFSSPIASFFTTPGVFVNANGSLVAAVGGLASTLGAGGPTVVFAPTVGFYGSVVVTFRGVDSRGVRSANTQTFTITVTNVEHAPLALFSSTTTLGGQSVTLELAGSDLDPESLLRATVTQLPSSVLYGVLYDLSGLPVAQSVELPSSTRLTSVSFSPLLAIAALDRRPAVNADFAFRLRDSISSVLTGEAIGTIAIRNNAIATATSLVIVEDTAITLQLAGVDLLPGGSITSFRLCREPSAGAVFQLGSGARMTVEDVVADAGARVTYLPAPDFADQDSFEFCCTSAVSGVESVPALFTLNVSNVNDAPRPRNALVEMFFLDGNTSFALTALEPDGDLMTFTVLATPAVSDARVLQLYNAALVSAATVITDPTQSLAVYPSLPTSPNTQGYYLAIQFTAADTFGATGTAATARVLVKHRLYAANLSLACDEDSSANFSLSTREYTGLPYTTQLASLPAHGTLARFTAPSELLTSAPVDVAADERLIYRPTGDFSGDDSFTYAVSRANERVVATVAIRVAAQADLPRITLPLTQLEVVDGTVLAITSLVIGNVDNSSALVAVNLTSLSTSLLAFGSSDAFSTVLTVTATSDELQTSHLAPLRFVTSSSQRVTQITTHLVTVRAESEGRSSESTLVITVLPANVKDNNSLDRVIVAAVIAASGAALLFGAVGAILLFKRRTRQPRLPPPPPFERYIFAGVAPPAARVDARTGSDLAALLEADNHALLFALLHVTVAADADPLARSLVHLAATATPATEPTKPVDLIVRVLTRELELVDEPGHVLRSTSFAAKMMGVHARLIGMPYLYTVLGPKLLAIHVQDGAGAHEVDQAKVRSPDVDVRVNRWQLLVVSQEFLKAIVESLDMVPFELRTIAHVLARLVEAEFPGHSPVALGAFFFARFIVPAIAQPELCGLLPGPPSRDLRRLLVLVAKTLQNVANGTLFKEEHLASMNVFISSNTEPLAAFLTDLAKLPSTKTPGYRYAMPPHVREAAYAHVFDHTVSARGDIAALVDAAPSPALVRMRDELNRICASSSANPAAARAPASMLAPPASGAAASGAAGAGARAGTPAPGTPSNL